MCKFHDFVDIENEPTRNFSLSISKSVAQSHRFSLISTFQNSNSIRMARGARSKSKRIDDVAHRNSRVEVNFGEDKFGTDVVRIARYEIDARG